MRNITLAIGAVLIAMASSCGRVPATPILVWEGAGPARAGSAAEWATALATRQPGVRMGTWGTSPDATFQLVESRAAEHPHIHQSHDLTVVLLRGQGVLRVDDREHRMRAGDVAHIGRGHTHWFRPTGRDAALSAVVFSPVLTAPDYHETEPHS
jgi:quercetin dioxygenase-like cupin family protein